MSVTNVFNKNFGMVNLTGGIQNIQGNNFTAFPSLNLLGNGNKHLRVNTLVGGGFGTGGNGIMACNDHLLFLNGQQLTINNQLNTAISAVTGGIVSETNAATGYGSVRWVCREKVGNYVVPFTSLLGQRIEYTLNVSTAGVNTTDNGYFSVSTFPTLTSANPNNRPLPSSVINTFNEYGRENAGLMADRFYIVSTGAFAQNPTATSTFSYLDAEIDASNGSTNTINAPNLRPIHYDVANNSWDYLGTGVSNPGLKTVTGSANKYRGIFTLADTTICPTAMFVWDGNCENDPVQFTDQSIGNGTSLERHAWDFDNGLTSNLQNPTSYFNSAALYNVKLIVTALSGCEDTVEQAVNIDARAVADFVYDDEPLVGIPVQFTETTINTTTFYWDFDDFNTSNMANPMHTFENEDSFQVLLIANNPANCPDTIRKRLEVWQPSLFLIPNAFSPGFKDDLNNTFGLTTLQRISEFEMHIYNRWGGLIFVSDNISKKWDGNYMGTEVMDGSYFYTIRFIDRQLFIHNYHGTITLMRN
jgi:gliding motility-associated-like protein